MNTTFLVDTDILIDAGRNIEKAVNFLMTLENDADLGISVITQLELMVGCRNKKEFQSLEKFLSRFVILSLDNIIAEKSVELIRLYRLSHGLLIADALIAATALIFKTPFVTKNQSDYQFIEGLNLRSY